MIRIALLVIAVFASGYGIFTFVLMEPNPAHWDLTVRFLFVLLCAACAAPGILDALDAKSF